MDNLDWQGVMYKFTAILCTFYLPNTGGWSDPPGLVAIVLSDIAGWVPYILSITFMVIGIILIVYDLISSSKWGAKQKNEMKARDKEFKASMEEDKKR